MDRHERRGMVVLAMAIVAAAILASPADGAVVKNKETGETLKGKLTNQYVNELRVFVLENGTKKFLKMDQWDIIEEDAPEETPEKPVAQEPKPTPATATTTAGKTLVYVIPISGPIMSTSLAKEIEKSLAEAKTKKAGVIVFHVDTPGGRVQVASQIIDMIEKVDWAKTVAWVEGDVQKGAISAGAFISLGTEAIYMAPATTIGAAVPFHGRTTGSFEVDEKFQSIFRARFRALAQKRGHPVAIADAMVATGQGVVQVFVEDQETYVTVDEARRLENEHKSTGKFKRGKTVCKTGEIMTLTADEAVEFKLCKGLAKDQEELLKLLDVSSANFYEDKGISERVAKKAEADKKRFEAAKNIFIANIQQAQLSDPVYVLPPTMRGTKQWADQTRKCMAYLQKCAAAIKEIEKLASDENSDYPVSLDEINQLKSQMEAMYQRLGADMHDK